MKRQRWLDLWAFATSPHGLGLSPEAFWASTTRELEALRKVYERPIERWAITQADFRNAHFQTDVPWTAADFMGRGDRQKRQAELIASQHVVAVENARLQNIGPSTPVEELPDWARGPACYEVKPNG